MPLNIAFFMSHNVPLSQDGGIYEVPPSEFKFIERIDRYKKK